MGGRPIWSQIYRDAVDHLTAGVSPLPHCRWSPDPVVLEGHRDWVRDVAWAPSVGLPCSTIASCSQDYTVYIWSQDKGSEEWSKRLLHDFGQTVWRTAWSITGGILAVSCADNKVGASVAPRADWPRVCFTD